MTYFTGAFRSSNISCNGERFIVAASSYFCSVVTFR